MKTQYSVLTQPMTINFHDYKLAIEIDKNGHSDRNVHYAIKRQKATEQELDCKFVSIDPDNKVFGILELPMKYFVTSNNRLVKACFNEIGRIRV